jgi:hypothetical protein
MTGFNEFPYAFLTEASKTDFRNELRAKSPKTADYVRERRILVIACAFFSVKMSGLSDVFRILVFVLSHPQLLAL